MKIEDILKKQGGLYKNLTSNKTIEECNETIEKPKLVPYKGSLISEQEYNAISSLEKMLNQKPVIVNNPKYNNFEISIDNNQIIYLRIANLNSTNIPKEISCLTNLQILLLYSNQIQKLENLDNLPNLQVLWLYRNQIKNKFWPFSKNRREIKNLRKKGIKVHL